MPTGYTHKLMESDQSFREFALNCARAFGACVMLRDEPVEGDIPEFKPSLRDLQKSEEAKAERHRLLEMTDDERIKFGQSKKDEEIDRAEKYLAKEIMENLRLSLMRDRVMAWKIPTSEHAGLREFMLDQIKISMHSLEYSEKRIRDAKASFARDYYDRALAEATRDIEYHEKAQLEENERTFNRNRWVNELKASIS